MSEQYFEKINNDIDRNKEMFEKFLDFIEKEYFQNVLNKLDNIRNKKESLKKAEKMLKVDFDKLYEYIDVKMPKLLEKIKEIVIQEDNNIISRCSLKDVLGNSILFALNRIVWIVENLDNNNKRIEEKVFNDNSATRRIIKEYIDKENEYGAATYYVDELCQDEKKLVSELGSENGYLEKFENFFREVESGGRMYKHYPTGGKKLPYFKFFSELEKGNIIRENIDEMLEMLDDSIVNKDKIRKDFFKK